jgi:peptide chain release factor 2
VEFLSAITQNMNDLKPKLEELKARLEQALSLVKIEEKKAEIQILQDQMSRSDFWQDQENAKKVSRQASDLQVEVDQWQNFQKEINDTSEVLDLDIADQSVNLTEELNNKFAELESRFIKLELNLLLSGKYDRKDALLSIYAGSGGTDAQDWAEMLLRMYLRFCEKQGWATKIQSISPGQEAGIKSVTFEVSGNYAFGYLKAEKGVHRLVRISPFDAEKMRHTSFAMVEVLPLFEEEVKIEIASEDLRIDTYRAGGHGGQSVNTTDSAVRITHLPTGVVATCQNERSQVQNKEKALKILKSKLQQYYETEIEDERKKLKGEFTEAAWGNQARSYVLHPYKMVKDHRTEFETTEVEKVLDGEIMEFIEAYLQQKVDNK